MIIAAGEALAVGGRFLFSLRGPVLAAAQRLVTRSRLLKAAAKDVGIFVAVDEGLEYAGNYSSWVEENRGWITLLAGAAFPGRSYLKTKGVSGKPLKAWFAANIGKRVDPSILKGLTFNSSLKRKGAEFVAEARTSAGDFVRITRNRSKGLKFESNIPHAQLILASAAVGGVAALVAAGTEGEALEDLARSGLLIARTNQRNVEYFSAVDKLVQMDPIALLGQPRNIAEDIKASFPTLSREVVASMVSRVLHTVEHHSGRFWADAFEQNDRQYIQLNTMLYSFDKSKHPMALDVSDLNEVSQTIPQLDAERATDDCALALIELLDYCDEHEGLELAVDDGVAVSRASVSGSIAVWFTGEMEDGRLHNLRVLTRHVGEADGTWEELVDFFENEADFLSTAIQNPEFSYYRNQETIVITEDYVASLLAGIVAESDPVATSAEQALAKDRKERGYKTPTSVIGNRVRATATPDEDDEGLEAYANSLRQLKFGMD